MPSILRIVAVMAIAGAIAIVGLVVTGWLVWGRGDGAVAEPMPDFATLAPHETPNQYLALPPGYHSDAYPYAPSPVFDLPVAELERRAVDSIRAQPRVTEVAADPAHRQYAFVQRTRLLRFPDTVTVRFVDLGDGKSSLAVYSRSKFGHSDLGANEARVRVWLEAITAAAGGD